MSNNIRVGLTHGDYNGVGYEVTIGALAGEGITELFTPVIFGYQALAEKCRNLLGVENMKFNRVQNAAQAQDGQINIVNIGPVPPEVKPGEGTPESGRAAVKALDMAVEALKNGDIDVLVTAPISKEACQGEGFHFTGHTEYLENAAGPDAKARMILFNDSVKVALVSTHLPVAKIAEAVTEESVGSCIGQLHQSLRQDFAIVRPRIAVLSLNPHAGDGGLLGNEEQEVIIPAIAKARESGILAFGPFAADGFFGSGDYTHFDGVVAMYHDQGLAPFKTLAGTHGVNFTAALPFVRTSPDHGTAFSIAWKGEADPTSMREAIYQAIDIFRRRSVYQKAAANPLRKSMPDRPDRGERQDRGPRVPKTAAPPQPTSPETQE